MTRISLTIRNEDDRRRAVALVVNAALGMRVDLKQERRSLPQNDLMWGRLADLSNQADLYGEKLTPADWKDVMTAGLRRTRIVRNIDGDGFVQLGLHTSDLTKEEMTLLLDLIDAFGAKHGVKFTDQQDDSHSPEATPPSQADTPAVPSIGPQLSETVAAGVISCEASLLSDDWRYTYFAALTRPGDRRDSLVTRHQQALQMLGGEPNAAEIAWMRLAWALVRDRNEGAITPDEFMAEKTRLLHATLPETGEAA